MLDQNTTTLLAALLGGLLTIAGGFIANYYIQSSSDRIQKKKEIRNLLEQIYKSTQIITADYSDLKHGVLTDDMKKKEKAAELFDNIDEIERRVNLYLPPLKESFTEYKEEILSYLTGTEQELFERTEECQKQKEAGIHLLKIPSIEETDKKFRASLSKMLKENGYSYF